MMDAFEEIKARVSIEDAARRYGLAIGRGGMVKCPFHKAGNERHPSMKLYPGRFHCFTCGASGDVVELVRQLYDLSTPFEAVRFINRDFGLNLFLGRPITQLERQRAALALKKREQDKALVKSFDAWLEAAWHTVPWYHWHLRDEWERLRPRTVGEDLNAEFVHVMREAERTQYMLECLVSGDKREQIDFYAAWRGKVKQIELYRDSRAAQAELAG